MSEIDELKRSLSARLRGDWPSVEAIEALARAIAREVAAEVYEARARFGEPSGLHSPVTAGVEPVGQAGLYEGSPPPSEPNASGVAAKVSEDPVADAFKHIEAARNLLAAVPEPPDHSALVQQLVEALDPPTYILTAEEIYAAVGAALSAARAAGFEPRKGGE